MDTPPITFGQDISELLANSNEQNRLLTEQNRLLQEENERQKQQLIDAQKVAKRANLKSAISFCVGTILSIVGILVALLKN